MTATMEGLMKRNYQNPISDLAYEQLWNNLADFPFSFVADGKTYAGFSSEIFSKKKESVLRGEGKETRTMVFGFGETLEITLLLTHYFSHGATEWTVWFENVSDKNSPVLEKLTTTLTFDGAYPMLKGILGDHINQYQPYCHDLTDRLLEFHSDRGRSTHICFPYFNLEHGDGGTLLAIGWAGTWCARFSSDGMKTSYSISGVNNMQLYLKPGEKIRTPLFTMLPYRKRSEHYATNLWRSWYVEHNLPKMSTTEALSPFSACCLASDTGLPNSDGSISECHTTWRPSLEKMFAENAKVDFRWVDAGWYIAPDRGSAVPFDKKRDWGYTIGTWELDPAKWPGNSFRESTDFARANGMRTLVWFEPETVTYPEELAKNFGYNLDWVIRFEGERRFSNNIGDPACFDWTVGRITKMLRENRVEMYREDNNSDPTRLWNHLDLKEGEHRRGITECKFIDAHYRMWDAIIECTSSYGGCCFVDSCASGGGRNDLESMRRGVPLLRSDSDRTTTSLRLSMTTAFNKWIPFCGANTKEKKAELALTGTSDVYTWRASYLPILNVDSQFVQDPEQDFDILRFGLHEWKSINRYLLKEFYVLTPWHKEADVTDFTAYCFYDPESEEGILLVFRQERCKRDTYRFVLPFADGKSFTLTDEDTGEVHTVKGEGTLVLPEQRSAKLLRIKRA